MKRNCLFIAFFCLASLLMVSCSQGKFPGYKKTADGLYYKFYSQNTAAQKAQPTDFLKLSMACYLHDSLYFDFQHSGTDVYSQLTEQKFAGDLQEAYAMLHVGDSASFYIKADSIALRYYDQDPAAVGLKSDDYFRYEVKLLDLKSEEAFKDEIVRMKEQFEEDSKAALKAYIEREQIDVAPDESGVYIITTEKGKGRCPVKGEKVELDFAAYLLNGKEMGSTFGEDERFSFVLGENYVIPAWEDILPKMHLGERVRAIIPAEMAYGENQVGEIPAYSNLIYDIKLLKIISQEELVKQAEEEMKALKAKSEQAFWDYLKDNDITTYTKSGLFFNKTVVTEGAQPQEGQRVRIKFDASFLDGTFLGDSDQLGDYYEFKYGEHKVLEGLEEGVGMMRVGEKARFVLPYTIAYGENPFGNIPAYSNLVFDVELLDILNE